MSGWRWRGSSSEWLFDQRQLRIDAGADLFGQLTNRELVGVTQVDRPSGVAIHQTDQAIDQLVDVEKGTALAAISVKGDGPPRRA